MQIPDTLHRLQELGFLAALGFVEDLQWGAFQGEGSTFRSRRSC